MLEKMENVEKAVKKCIHALDLKSIPEANAKELEEMFGKRDLCNCNPMQIGVKNDLCSYTGAIICAYKMGIFTECKYSLYKKNGPFYPL